MIDLYRMALRDTPKDVVQEISRYGGTNPFGRPLWRVVLAQNVRDQRFGTMRNMPVVSAGMSEEALAEVEPESFESGEFCVPRYMEKGWILERWFPASTWGSQSDWEGQTSEDGETAIMGQYPRQGDYYQISVDGAPFAELPPLDLWKTEISRFLREMAHQPTDPAQHLSNHLYLERQREQVRREAYLEEVNHIHRSVVDPTLATIGRTAQSIRDGLMAEHGWQGHLSAG